MGWRQVRQEGNADRVGRHLAGCFIEMHASGIIPGDPIPHFVSMQGRSLLVTATRKATAPCAVDPWIPLNFSRAVAHGGIGAFPSVPSEPTGLANGFC